MRSTRIVAALSVLAITAGAVAASAGAKPGRSAKPAGPPEAATDVGLPSRVSNAITRAQNLVEAVGVSIDSGNTAQAVTQLGRITGAVARVNRAAQTQMNAPAD